MATFLVFKALQAYVAASKQALRGNPRDISLPPGEGGRAMVQEHRSQALAPLRQQIMALASISGVMLAALRRAGLMTDDLETLLASELAAAAAAQSDQAEPEWERMVAAVQKVAAGAAQTE